MNSPEPIYSEHKKLKAISHLSNAIGEFLEQKKYDGIVLCKFRAESKNWNNDHTDYDFIPEGYYPIYEQTEDMLARYFKIDQRRLEKEKRQMLKSIRATNGIV